MGRCRNFNLVEEEHSVYCVHTLKKRQFHCNNFEIVEVEIDELNLLFEDLVDEDGNVVKRLQ